ncbi:restriction endonuclease subunit S [Slackia isoflavoniconvertens]|uniref:restriction endonuclease subunit S n=1 Tax=Slackia isoflavoniconvertens TaxID=572010 RepID=UPI003AEF3A29
MKAKDLKNSILQMAVEGKLVPQDPSDEPASVLLERIREEKHRLIAEGKAKFPKGGESIIYIGSDGSPYEKRVDAKGRVLSDECIADQVPFEELPEGWAWVRLSSLFTKIGSGSTPAGGRKVYQNEGPMLIRSQNVHNGGLRLDDVAHFARSLFEKRSSHILPNDMLLNITGASIGRCVIVPGAFGDADVNQHVLIMRPIDKAINRFLHAAIISPVVQMAIMADQVGATKEGLSAAKAANLLAPIPPLAEQRRIVERAEELSALIEEYGRLEDAREELDAVLPGRLRKSVLQMAVQGKLVPQNPVDEPASALLERIRKQRRQLVAEKKMKAPKGGESVVFRGSDGRRYEKRIDAKGRESKPICIEDEIPFEIPDSWEWARLSSIASFGGGKTPSTNDRSNYAKDGVLWVTSKDMKKERIESTQITLSDKGASELTLYPKGCIVIVTRSGILRRLLPVAILDRPSTVNQDQKVIIPNDDSLSEWLLRFFQGSDQRIRSNFGKDGTTVESIVFDKIRDMLIPIPPLAEQHRIDACLREFIPLITNQ